MLTLGCISNNEAIIPEMYWLQTLIIVHGNCRLQQLLSIREVYEFQVAVLSIKLKFRVQFDYVCLQCDASYFVSVSYLRYMLIEW